MGLSAADIASLVSAVEVTVTLDGLPSGVTVTDYVTQIGGELRSEAQDALYQRYGTLPTDLPETVLHAMRGAVVGHALRDGYANQESGEEVWPDQYLNAWRDRLAAWASGVDVLTALVDEAAASGGMSSNDRVFTVSGFDALL